jgi:hypothetical protein
VVTRTRLNVALSVHCLSCSRPYWDLPNLWMWDSITELPCAESPVCGRQSRGVCPLVWVFGIIRLGAESEAVRWALPRLRAGWHSVLPHYIRFATNVKSLSWFIVRYTAWSVTNWGVQRNESLFVELLKSGGCCMYAYFVCVVRLCAYAVYNKHPICPHAASTDWSF